MAPVRQDLLALTPAAIASLANMGLFKRAQKEAEEGKGPRVETGEDGTVTAVFPEGVQARLVPGKALKDCPCSCGASAVCRHRVAAILAYQRAAPAAATPPTAARPWTPAEIDDEALEKLLGRGALDRARALRRRTVLVEVTRGDFSGEALPRAQLATSTVRFLVAGDPSYARCDCRARTGCEHVALAVWAFRAAAQKDPDAAVVTVEVSDGAGGERQTAGLSAAREVAALVLLEGATRLSPAAAARFALARLGLERGRMAWPASALEDVEELVAAYGRRSARYSPARLADALVDLLARARAGEGGGELPASAVLGSEEAPEAELDQLRLSALGARIEADGDERLVEVLLADPSSQSVLVVQRRYTRQEGAEPENGAELGRRNGLSGTSIAHTATCQLVSNAAVRRPNRLVTFRTGTLRKTSVLPGGAGLDAVPAALVVRDVAELERQLARRPPRVVRPRLLAENVRIFVLQRVEALVYDEGDQALRALCFGEGEAGFVVEGRHRAVAPGALASLAWLLSSGTVRAVVGDARRVGTELVVDPIAVWTDRIVVLDFQEERPEATQALAAVPHGRIGSSPDPLAEALTAARSLLAEAAHQGLRALAGPWATRLQVARVRLDDLGLTHAAHDLEVVESAFLAAQTTGAEIDEAALVEAWTTAALRLELLEGQSRAAPSNVAG